MPTFPRGSTCQLRLPFLFLFVFAADTFAQATPQAKSATEAPWKLQAQRAAQVPLKLDVRQISTRVHVGSRVGGRLKQQLVIRSHAVCDAAFGKHINSSIPVRKCPFEGGV